MEKTSIVLTCRKCGTPMRKRAGDQIPWCPKCEQPGGEVPLTKLRFSYDPVEDVLTVEGNRFSGDFFRFFAGYEELKGKLFQLVRRDPNGEITIKVVH